MFTIQNRFACLRFSRWAPALVVGSSLLLAAVPALAESYGAVKVECWGNCAVVNLGQICDKFRAASIPVAVACDDTAWPGSGSTTACGNTATCIPFGNLVRSDLLSAYCTDGGGSDAVITCRAP